MTPDPIAAPAATYGTRWGRAGIAAGAAFLAVGAMSYGMVGGALGSSYVATSAAGALTVQGLRTDHVAAITRPMLVKAADGSIYTDYVATFLIGTGYVNGLCFTEKATILGQPFTVLVTAGDDDPSTEEIQLDGMALDIFEADAFLQALGTTYVNKNPMDIAIDRVPTTPGAGPDDFGLEAGGVVLKHAVVRHQGAEITRLPPGVRLEAQMLVGDHDCPSG